MNRCSWCNRILWPWTDVSVGKSMHFNCWLVTQRIIHAENQRQYTPLMQARPKTQQELRAEEEDAL